MSNNTCPMQMLWFVFLFYSAEMRSEANAVQEHPFDRTLCYVQYIKRYFCTRPEKVCRPIYIIFYYSFRVFCTALALLIFPFCTAFMYDLCSKVLFLWWYRPPYLLSSHKYPKPFRKLYRTFLTRDTEMMFRWRENSVLLTTFWSNSMQYQEVIDPDLLE